MSVRIPGPDRAAGFHSTRNTNRSGLSSEIALRQSIPGQARLIQPARIEDSESAFSSQFVGNPTSSLFCLDHLQVAAQQAGKQSGCIGIRFAHKHNSGEPLREKDLLDRSQFPDDSILQRARQFGDDAPRACRKWREAFDDSSKSHFILRTVTDGRDPVRSGA